MHNSISVTDHCCSDLKTAENTANRQIVVNYVINGSELRNGTERTGVIGEQGGLSI